MSLYMPAILKSLLITKTENKKILIHPAYKLFKHKLEVVWFKDMRTLQRGSHTSFKEMEKSIKDKGLLFPLVLNQRYTVLSGTNRCRIIRRYGHGTLVYLANTTDEIDFFVALNKESWCLSESENGIESFGFLFEGQMHKYTEKVMHLFTKNIRRARR